MNIVAEVTAAVFGASALTADRADGFLPSNLSFQLIFILIEKSVRFSYDRAESIDLHAIRIGLPSAALRNRRF